MRAQRDLKMKHTSSSHGLRYKAESQGRELKHLKMSLLCLHGESKERMSMTKMGEWKFYFACRSTKIQSDPRETTCDMGNTDEL